MSDLSIIGAPLEVGRDRASDHRMGNTYAHRMGGSGTVTDHFAYGVFGDLVSHTGSSTTPFRFSGRWGVQSDSNGLYYHRTRYYHPGLRRFLNQDATLGSISVPMSLNRFAYANGNPMSLIDPFGTMAQDAEPGGLGKWIMNALGFDSNARYSISSIGADPDSAALLGDLGISQNDFSKNLFAQAGAQLINDAGEAAAIAVGQVAIGRVIESAAFALESEGLVGEAESRLSSKLFRGGQSVEARLGVDVKQSVDGLIHPLNLNGRPQGLSLHIDPKNVFVQKYGGAFPVNKVPEGLQILASGQQGHYVIAPSSPMTFERFQQLLNQVELGIFNSIR